MSAGEILRARAVLLKTMEERVFYNTLSKAASASFLCKIDALICKESRII